MELVQESGFNYRYQKIWDEEFHPGIISLIGVPDFTNVRWHMGNTHRDTAGCLLIGSNANFVDERINSSRRAYERIYPIVRDKILSGPTFVKYEWL